MEAKTMARIAAVGIVAIALTATALQMRDAPAGHEKTELVPDDQSAPDPIRIALRRCQAIGAAGANDVGCLRVWAEQRRRFFLGGEPDSAPKSWGEAEPVASSDPTTGVPVGVTPGVTPLAAATPQAGAR